MDVCAIENLAPRSELLITPRLDIGGEELSTIAIAKELKKRGHKVFYMSSGGPLLKELKRKNIDYLKGRVDGRGFIGIIRGACEIRKVLTKYRIDIIHCAEPRPTIMGFFASRFCFSRKTKVIWHDRGTASHFLSGKIFNFLCDFVITNSYYEKNELVQKGLSPEKVKVIHNSMYLSLQKKRDPSDIFDEFGIDFKNGHVIGMTSRLISRKGHKYLLEAVPQILKCFNKAKLLIVGGGGMQKKLKLLTKKLRIQNEVIFTGFRSDLERIYPFLDIFVVPSLYEAFGNVSMEAMGFGKPVVASNTGGIPEVVEDGVTGILVSPKDSEKLAEAIIYLLKNPDIAKKMGEAGKKRVQEYFTIQKVGDELERVYNYVMTRN